MTLYLGIPTLRRFDLLTTCVWSALAGIVKPNRVVIIDNSGGTCPPIPGADIVLGRQPQSVARAWNDLARTAFADGADLIISNDDITFAPDTIEQILAVAKSQPKAGIVSPIEGQRFACFWLSAAAYADVGPFDEQFSPAYFEDNDYHHRLTIKGWGSPIAPSDLKHEVSGTMKATPMAECETIHHEAFRACRRRYVYKWGGMPGEEQFATPYGAQP